MKALGTVIRRTVPFRAGQHIQELETPCLVVHKEIMVRNLAKMQHLMAAYPQVRYRAHAKAHKCPPIAHLQVEYGSHGVCCQKLCEAEAMVQGGIKDVFISNEVVSDSKLKRMVSLAKKAKISICVDDKTIVQKIAKEAKEGNCTIDVLVEVNVGQDRCGVDQPEAAADIAQCIEEQEALEFKGIQAYNGAIQHIRHPEDRKKAVDKVLGKTVHFLDVLSKRNINVDTVTGGGTGTFMFEAASGIYTEVQPGSYIFGDVDYSKNLEADGKTWEESQTWEQSLFVLSTVTSVANARRAAILDAGMKAVSLDSGPPVARDLNAVYQCGGDEHGILMFEDTVPCAVGEVTKLIPGHCDPTVNMYEVLLPIEDHHVMDVWPIASGPGY